MFPVLIIKNTNLYDMNSIHGEKKDILIQDGKIMKIDDNIDIPEDNTIQVIDAMNKIVTPGIVEPHCELGVSEQVNVAQGLDANENTDPITPQLRAIDAINPEDEGFQMALDAGVTTAVTGPGNINLIGGTFAAIKTYGNTVEKMSIVDEIAFKFSLGNLPKGFYGGKGKSPKTRLGNAALIREALYKAREYDISVKKYKTGESKTPPAFDIKLDSLSRVFNGMLVKFHAQQTYDIMTAVRIAEEFNLKYTVDKCSEAYLITEDLKAHNVNLVVGASFGGKRTHEVRNQDVLIGKVLEEKGIDFSISSGHPDINISLTMIQPIMMVRKGLSREKALRGITIDAAKSVGLDNRIGSIEVGKDADILIWDGEPLDYYSSPSTVIIDGKVVLDR